MVEFQRILIPVMGTDADEQAIRLAAGMAKKNKGKVWAVYVITVKRALPVEAEIEQDIQRGEAVLDHMESIAEEVGIEIETDLLQAREVGPAIVDEAVELGADLILMGVTYKRRFGQFTIGNVVPYVFKNASCRVILYHQPVPVGEATE
ncbi:MAG: universal stress protein [Chloroflexi bacterium]|nr:universal stress protein [Chloroflexota bacterium]